MIEDSTIKDKVFAITSYCDTIEKLNVLTQNIRLIRIKFPEYKIALHANYPLSTDIQKMVDFYVYEDLNYVPEDKWIYYWRYVMNQETNEPYFTKKFFYVITDIGFSVFQQIKALTKYLIEYKWMILINYDTSVEEIRIEDYKDEYDLILHFFPGRKAVSLIIMAFRPQIFYEKLAKYFTFQNWNDDKRRLQLNEERFFDMVNESGINYFANDYEIFDKINNMPDFFKNNEPNAPKNDFFQNYLLCNEENTMEIYLWNLLQDIHTISFGIDNEYGKLYVVTNQNKLGAFEYASPVDIAVNGITISQINNTYVNIELKIQKGYSARYQ